MDGRDQNTGISLFSELFSIHNFIILPGKNGCYLGETNITSEFKRARTHEKIRSVKRSNIYITTLFTKARHVRERRRKTAGHILI